MAKMSQERLDELDERIQKVRRDAEEHDILPDSTPESTFIEPSPGEPDDEPEEIGSNQIAPPG